MVQGRFRLTSLLAATLAAYLLTLAAILRWHWVEDLPLTQTTLSLMVAFGLCVALLGMSSMLVALVALHWMRRVSGLVVGVAVLGLFCKPFFDWDQFLMWQLLVIFAAQTGCLVVVLVAARSLGCSLMRLEPGGVGEGKASSNRTLQLSISDILVFTVAIAFFCAVMRGSQPIELGLVVYGINIAGGCCAAFVGLTIFWACFGTATVPLRSAALVLVAPIGGAVYVLAARYASLLFSWQWYSGVTTAQVLFMAIPCLILRADGFRFVRRG